MERGWELPDAGFIKINVHAVHYGQPLANGNDSGMGIVLRDDQGDIIAMVSGCLRHLSPMGVQLWSMVMGLRCARTEGKNRVILETESAEAIAEWDNWRWGGNENYISVIDQLEKRRKDKNLTLHKQVIRPSQNQLARYLADDGGQNRTRLVTFRRPFGRVRELWHLDMGLGLVHGDYDLIEEDDYLNAQQVEMGNDGLVDFLGVEGVPAIVEDMD